MEIIYSPWPWYVAGPIISLIMLFLILLSFFLDVIFAIIIPAGIVINKER